MSVPAVHDYGPYTLYDLDALPEDGKRYELADGWLTELSPSPWHDHAADRLKDILKDAGRLAGAPVYIAGGPNDIATPEYALTAEIRAGQTLTASEPFTISFGPRALTELE